MTLIDLFREFNKEAVTKSYPPSARSLFHTLLWIWNDNRRPAEISLPRNSLLALTGLPDSTFRDAFAYLSSRGWIKRLNSRNRKTYTYSMREEHVTTAQAVDFPMNAHAREKNVEGREIFPEKISLPTQTEENYGTTKSNGATESPNQNDFGEIESALQRVFDMGSNICSKKVIQLQKL